MVLLNKLCLCWYVFIDFAFFERVIVWLPVWVLQGQSMGSGSITSAMQTNAQLMEIQIRLVHALTQLQVKHALSTRRLARWLASFGLCLLTPAMQL